MSSDEGLITCEKPDLTVDKTPDAQNINAGEDVVFDITVTNNGPGTAKAVKLSDPLPGPIDGTWAVSGADAADCVDPIVGDTLDCTFGDSAASALQLEDGHGNRGDQTSTPAPPTTTPQPRRATNSPNATDDGEVTCEKPDLTVDKTPDAQNINAGEDVVFDITVTNNGPGTAKAVKLSDPLPGPIAGTWAVSGADAADCVDPIVGAPSTAPSATCPASAPCSSKTVTVTAATNFDTCAAYDNTATATATNSPNATDDGEVTCEKPDLTVDKTPDAQNINAGEDVVFDITVTNNGPGTAKAVKLSDPLPGPIAGTWAVSGADAADCVDPIVGDTLDCTFGDLDLRVQLEDGHGHRGDQLRRLRRLRQHRDRDAQPIRRTQPTTARSPARSPTSQSTRPPTPRTSTPARTWSSTSRSPTTAPAPPRASSSATRCPARSPAPGRSREPTQLTASTRSSARPSTAPSAILRLRLQLEDGHGHRGDQLRRLRRLRQHRDRERNQLAERNRRRRGHLPEARTRRH